MSLDRIRSALILPIMLFGIASYDSTMHTVGQDESFLTPSNGHIDFSSSNTLFQWNNGFLKEDDADSDEPLVTDRPDFTEASSTVGLGVYQLEFGYTYSFDNDGTTQTKSNSFGEPLLRFGAFANWFELRLGTNYLVE